MRRREFITLLGGTAAWPVAARAQQQPAIGYLGSELKEFEAFRLIPLREGLAEAGFVEGQNVAIEYGFAEGQYHRLPALAADLVGRHVRVIIAGGHPSAVAAKAATATIPIVFQFAGDPVELGFVASLNRPGGNLTGVTSLNVEVAPKQLELLHEAVPTATVVALLVNPGNPQTERTTREAQFAARRLGLELQVFNAGTDRDLDTIFTLIQRRVTALVISPDSFFTSRREQLGALTLRHAVPAISPYRDFAATGGLMSYGTNIPDLYRRVGAYASRILKGEKPADLPVQQAMKIEFVVNLKTAKSLGLDIPRTLIARADEVIE
jgi:putative ABC transport system substrate-binding protein